MVEIVEIVDASAMGSPGEQLQGIADRYVRTLATPQMRAGLQRDLAAWAHRHEVEPPPMFWYDRGSGVHIGRLPAAAFAKIVGRPPECDDLERVNCSDAGGVGHFMCGWCDACGRPRFECGHR